MTSAIYKTEAGGEEILRLYREALRAWPVPAEQVRVPTREGETFAVVCGPRDAPPLLLLHGSGTNTAMWAADAASWSRHFRVHAVDLVGEPGLSAPSRPPLDSDALSLWLDDVLDGLGLAETAIVGASLGGWLALDYAVRRPERVTRLALLCPGGLGRQRIGWLFKLPFLRLLGTRGVRMSARAITGLDARRDRAVLDILVLTFTHFKPRTERLPAFPDEALRRLDMPVFVMVGGRDAMLDSKGTARRVRECVRNATVHLLPEAGHSILGQGDSVLAFLRGRPASEDALHA